MTRRPVLLQVRPRRIAIFAAVAAVLVVASMVVIGVLLHGTNDGVSFRVADQVGLIGIGLVVGGGIMLVARPRLRVDETGLRVRNVLGEVLFEWPLVYRISFPEGAHWAHLEMADDEYYPVMAIQAMDRRRAVTALAAVRSLHARFAPPPPVVSAADAAEVARREAAAPPRQLGRLEIIDREKAGHPKRRHPSS